MGQPKEHIFDITNTSNISEVAFVEGAYTGPGVIHRDYHDYNGYLYAVCDEGSSSTLQIIDISNLPISVNVVYDSNNLFSKAHNIFIDTATAKLYSCASTNYAMDIYDLTNPTNPSLIYSYDDVGHVHDAYVKNDTAYLNCGYDGFKIVDFNNSNIASNNNHLELASLTSYPDAGYNHSGWLNDDGTIYVMMDENHGYDVKILDVSDFSNISVISTFNSNVNSQSMAHNGIIKNNMLFIAYYHDGLRVFDISNPFNPIQTWMYDTYSPNSHASYKGAWGVYPYFQSENIVVSDMQTGLYILKLDNNTIVSDDNIKKIIYPNPINGYFSIQSEINTFELFDITQNKVMQQKINGHQVTIDRKNIKSGVYFYKIKNIDNSIEYGKLIFN